MVPEYWELGEQVQDRIRRAGFETGAVEGIAVDLHDLLQAVDSIRERLAPAVPSAPPESLPASLGELAQEVAHICWHCDSAIAFLEAAAQDLSGG